MMTRRRLLTACGALCGLFIGAATLSATNANHLEYMTFSAPVALPGVTLGAGAYSFEIANDSGSVVLVRDRATRKPLFLGLTNRVERPARAGARSVVIGEARRGEAAPIMEWYPENDTVGRQFIYR